VVSPGIATTAASQARPASWLYRPRVSVPMTSARRDRTNFHPRPGKSCTFWAVPPLRPTFLIARAAPAKTAGHSKRIFLTASTAGRHDYRRQAHSACLHLLEPYRRLLRTGQQLE